MTRATPTPAGNHAASYTPARTKRQRRADKRRNNAAFWRMARRLLRERALLTGAIVAAVISAGGLGAGLLGIAPILDALIGKGKTLAQIATDFNAKSPVDVPAGIIDRLPSDPFTAAIALCSLLCLLTVIGATANFFHMYLSLTAIERTIAGVRRDLFAAVVRFPLSTVIQRGASDQVSRVVNDPQQLGSGFSALLGKGVAQVTKGIAAFIAALIISFPLTIITLVVVPLIAIVIRKLGKRIRRASRGALRRQAGLYGVAAEVLEGLRIVRVFGTERREIARFHRENKGVLKHLLRARSARALSGPLIETMSIFIVAGLALIAIKAVNDGEIDATSMLLAIGSLGVSAASLRPLTGLISDIQHSAAAAERVAETLESPAEPGRDRSLPRLPRLARSIDFEAVQLTYPGATEPALRGVTLSVRAGETVALVGPNGSGKTSLLSLVPRLFDPSPGAVRFDNTDLRDVSIRSLRDQIAAVTQETILFRGTIGENIAYGSRSATKADIEDAARRARAEDFINEKGGLDAPVGERGLNLSGGQRQRIAIARAILRDPAVLLLDEATSMIDAESEAKIADALEAFGEGRTTLVIAHRLSTVINADRIAVLDQGTLIDVAPHDTLMQRCEIYRTLADRQLVPAK